MAEFPGCLLTQKYADAIIAALAPQGESELNTCL